MRERYERRSAEAGSSESLNTLTNQIYAISERLERIETALNEQDISGVGDRLDRLESIIISFDSRLNPGLSVLEGRLGRMGQQSTIIGGISIFLLVAVAIIVIAV